MKNQLRAALCIFGLLTIVTGLAYPVLVRGEEILWVPGVCRSATDVPKPGDAALRIDARRR